VNIKEVEVLNFKKESIGNIQDYIKSFIMKVKGDFRQEEILEKWSEYFYNKNSDDVLYSVEVKIKVSSGTYIRGLTENISTPGGSALLLKLNRTKIFI
jgi:tRNA U55 pseudouridine synthase TruB